MRYHCYEAYVIHNIRVISIKTYGKRGCKKYYCLSKKALWHFHKNIRSRVKNECCCPRTVNILNNTKASIQNSKWLAALIAQMVRAFGMNSNIGFRVPLRSRLFLSQNLWHSHTNTRSCVENDCCCLPTVNSANVNFTSKISIPPEPVFWNMGQQMSVPDSSNG